MTTKTYDLHVDQFIPLIAPGDLKKELPLTPASERTVIEGRKTIQKILAGKDDRLMVITGPCSIHDEAAALDYARKLVDLQHRVKDHFYLVMRVYFEKPRTTVGWKGLINDPYLDGTCDMEAGLRRARKLLLDITAMGLPTATELLDPITPQYIAGLVCWAAVGARTTESQTHREMASGLSMPVGFKNATDGDLNVAINAIMAAGAVQNFIGIDPEGRTCVVRTTGNPWTHLVLRGGGGRPNYDSVSLAQAADTLTVKGLPPAIMVDCSHANSGKDYRRQPQVWQDVINQRLDGNRAIIGIMLESNLNAGNQKIPEDLKELAYGISITDACIDWETTASIIQSANEQFAGQRTNGHMRYRAV
ncbi:MAG: 3-deoxy-7-phosphoheptulonate synthase [Desulfosarcinaceae bacterium]|nr:3-deoxy-7-phosphoheptulonate synthase [Desulfosarcinaceae bacterium]